MGSDAARRLTGLSDLDFLEAELRDALIESQIILRHYDEIINPDLTETRTKLRVGYYILGNLFRIKDN